MKIILKDGRTGDLVNHDGNIANVNIEHKGMQQILLSDIKNDVASPLPALASVAKKQAATKKAVVKKAVVKKKAATKKAVAKAPAPVPPVAEEIK